MVVLACRTGTGRAQQRNVRGRSHLIPYVHVLAQVHINLYDLDLHP